MINGDYYQIIQLTNEPDNIYVYIYIYILREVQMTTPRKQEKKGTSFEPQIFGPTD